MVSTNTYFLSGKSSFVESFFSLLILIPQSNLKRVQGFGLEAVSSAFSRFSGYLRLSLKSSTRIISLMRCSGLLLRTLTMVLSKVDLASLWNVMITEVGGNCSCFQSFALQAPLRVSGTSLLLATFNWSQSVHGLQKSCCHLLYSPCPKPPG